METEGVQKLKGRGDHVLRPYSLTQILLAEGNSTDALIDKRPMATVTIESNLPQLEVEYSMETEVQKYKRHPWSEEEVSAVYSAFKRDILLN
ncbi:hypothetical protein HOLleu_29254 [Holothuria leucospilota]|uniref:Uncharacterized protein n=1 Tax=Holothuria leucospilota TaxID=206669 RepID=A0A9Q1H247_HOLLE|nr:hypothetical protein HOLleu_29254 [Holothuria leucospilota]